MSIRKELNEYLFHEFGEWEMESDLARITEDFPYVLKFLADIEMPGMLSKVYGFTNKAEEFYALHDSVMTEPGEIKSMLMYLPAHGMELADLRHQMMGSSWIGEREPMDLSFVRLGDDSVPSTTVRREMVKMLAAQVIQEESAVRILEGLWLRESDEFLGLVEDTRSGAAWVVGSGLLPRPARFPAASPWRRLSVVIGELMEESGIEEME